jgi:GT2 family glycosyltransferase
MISLPRVAAVVLNYNGRDVTLDALASLTRMTYPSCRLLVVDNGSTDGSYAAIAGRFPQVEQVRTERNLGPAGGVDLGLEWALAREFDYVLVLNNDIEVAPGFLSALVEAAEADPTLGCVGPKAYYHAEPEVIWSAGGRIAFREAVTRETGEGEVDRGQWDRDREVPYVNGCAMLIRRAALEAAGLWDPTFFLGVEDADFCMRVRRAGYRCGYAHRARLWHRVSHNLGTYRAPRTYNTGRNTALFARRYARPWQWVTVVGFFAASLPVAFVRELFRGNQKAVVAKLRGFLAGLKAPLPPPPAPIAPGVRAERAAEPAVPEAAASVR